MNLEENLAQTLSELAAARQGNSTLSWSDIPSLIDLTLLDENATPGDIHALALKARQNEVAAICIFPDHLDYVSADINIKRATVINFPSGNQSQQQVLKAIEEIATTKQADEIDYVFPYSTYLAGNQNTAFSWCHETFQHCKKHTLTFKVILETGALPSMDVIYDVSVGIINNGCDFLKTSTGKINTGATIPAVFSMLSAITNSNSSCGIKISGGVKTIEQALSYMQLSQYMLKRKLDSTCFRIGASTLLNVLGTAHQCAPHQ